MGLQAEQIKDIVSMVKDAEDRNTYTLLTTELQKYPAMNQLFKGKGRRERGGEQLSFNAMVASNESAQTTSLFAEIDVAQPQGTGTASRCRAPCPRCCSALPTTRARWS